MIKPLLIWDFDGVMADSTEFVFSFWRQAFAEFGHDFTLTDYQETFTYKFPFDCLRERFGETIVEKIYRDYSAYEAQEYPANVPAFPHFIEGFKSLAPHYEHHLVSSNLAAVIDPWLSVQGIRPHFSSIIGREQAGYKDEKITQLLQQKGVQGAEVQFIGDTTSDVEHAHQAGVKSVAVTWGVHPASQLRRSHPHFMFNSIPELFEHLTP